MDRLSKIWSAIIETIDLIKEWIASGSMFDAIDVNFKEILEGTAAGFLASALFSLSGILVGVLASLALWRLVYLHFRAATIRKAAGRGFVLVLCPIKNDQRNAIGREISARIEEAFLAFSGLKGSRRPFEVLTFPLALSDKSDTATFDRSVRRAKRWLERTNGEILIWGHHVRDGSVGVVRLIGRDISSGLLDTRRVDFDKTAKEFDQALANAIAVEMVSLKSVIFQEPYRARVDLLRSVTEKFERLAGHEAPALDDEWRTRMAVERDRLQGELLRRSDNLDESWKIESKARTNLAALSTGGSAKRVVWARAALLVGIATRKRSFIDSKVSDLKEVGSWQDWAVKIFVDQGKNYCISAAEAAIERCCLFYYELECLGKSDLKFELVRETLNTAERLSAETKIDRISQRAFAQKVLLWSVLANENDEDIARFIHGFQSRTETLRNAVFSVMPSLDGQERVEFLKTIGDLVLEFGIVGDLPELLRTTIGIFDEASSRFSFSEFENVYLYADLAQLMSSAAGIIDTDSRAEAESLWERAGVLSRDVLRVVERSPVKTLRRLEIQCLLRGAGLLVNWHAHRGDEEIARRALGHLRAAVSAAEERGFVSSGLWLTLIVALNNFAHSFDMRKEALEAYSLSKKLLSKLDRSIFVTERVQARYVSAYAAWQIARLTSKEDERERESLGKRAHDLAVAAFEYCAESEFISRLAACEELLILIEREFPDLAPEPNAFNRCIRSKPIL